MEWLEVRIKTASEAVELVTGLLMANNIPNLRIIDDEAVGRFLLDHPLNWDYKDETKPAEGAEVLFYLQEDAGGVVARLEDSLLSLANDIPEINFGPLAISSGPVNDDDWLHEWRKTYKTFAIGKNILVRPVWEELSLSDADDRVVFTIDPGAVFGTGLHATTQLCIMALEDVPLADARVLDIGCGSGILSLIALLLGADKALACDIDPGAVRCATENARLNGIDSTRYEVRSGDVFDGYFLPEERCYDIVLANIVADVIIGLAPIVKKYMRPGGVFISSGIIDERAEDVRQAIENSGFKLSKELEMDGWNCLTSHA